MSLAQKGISVNASTSDVWGAVTMPGQMIDWMFDDAILIQTDWLIGSPFVIRGSLHGIDFENKGTILAFEPKRRLSYSHLSSLSHLPDVVASYSIIDMLLQPAGSTTSVSVMLSNFPTESIRKHLEFYWAGALTSLKRYVEHRANAILPKAT